MITKPRVLVVDDEETIRKLLKSRLERDGFEVELASDALEAEATLKHMGQAISTVVTDIKMPGKDGIELLKSVKKSHPMIKIIMITGHGEKEVAIQALREGASDYLEKPFDLEELSLAVQRCVREFQLEVSHQDHLKSLEARVERVEGKTSDQFWFVSQSPSMAKVNEWLTVLRRESMRGEAEEPTVLILGESGTGKEGIARMVHAGSRRARGAWVAVNCANFSEQLLESELFGHEKGSFTGATGQKRGLFEIAKGGTLFLDEMGEMDVKLQSKLLRVLQEKVFRRVGGTQDIETNVRVVAATNQNLLERIDKGEFREDLYHRLSRVVIEMPPLRDRHADIVPMAMQFCERAFQNRRKVFAGFESDAVQQLEDYSWPGNVRELLNVVERAALLHQGEGKLPSTLLSLPKKDGVAAMGSRRAVHLMSVPAIGSDPLLEQGYTALKEKWIDDFERNFLLQMLGRHGGNVSASARECKLNRSNFLRLLRKHGIGADPYRAETEPVKQKKVA